MAQSQGQQATDLSTPNRYITDHDDSGLSVFNTSIPEPIPVQLVDGSKFHLGYTTDKIPTDFAGRADVASYSSFLSKPPGIFLPGGSVLRVIDMKPGDETIMHRTHSIDYGIVLDGDIELILDSGESRSLKKSDVVIQRGTNHLWRNKSKTEWGRMVFVSLEAKPVEIDGKVLPGIGADGADAVIPSAN